MKSLLTVAFCIILSISSQIGADYTAAVIEFYPEQDETLSPDERLTRNVDGYLKLLKEIAKDHQKLDIVIFPESTLATKAIIVNHNDYLPFAVEVSVNQSLCVEEEVTFLTPLACATRTYNTYLVINLYEKTPSDSTENGWDYYNTNVVLDRSGKVISRYRKYNLFGEMFMNQTSEPDVSFFDTDFGVRFGTFICFDILFKEPALELIRNHKITDVIYPTMWFSELPFLTALQAQLQWAYAVDATFLAAGANDPERGSGGTGFYQGIDGAVTYDILGNNESKAFVAQLPAKTFVGEESVADVDKKAKQMDGFYLKIDNLAPYTSKIIPSSGAKEFEKRVCHGDFCCDFKIKLERNKVDDKNNYVYHMLAFDGVRSFSGVYNGGVQICGVVACTNENTDSCGKRFPNYDNISWPTTFERIEINAEFEIDDDKIQHPNSLLSNIKPLPADAIEWTNTIVNSTITRTYILKKRQNRLMTFAIYGRDFSRDSEPSHDNSNTHTLKLSLLIILLILNLYV
ncbi:hypothetical protein FQR65_LT13310 [Abscondita terminalis]|nr:hypothetical protein FQR65_LT13310 [Abscondita terminalis]